MFSTVALVFIVVLASWMGYAYGGYFVGDWGLAAFVLAALMLVAAAAGVLGGASSWWSAASTSLTLFYLLAFWLVTSFVALGASRRLVLVASAIGPGLVAAFMATGLTSGIDDLFRNERLLGMLHAPGCGLAGLHLAPRPGRRDAQLRCDALSGACAAHRICPPAA